MTFEVKKRDLRADCDIILIKIHPHPLKVKNLKFAVIIDKIRKWPLNWFFPSLCLDSCEQIWSHYPIYGNISKSCKLSEFVRMALKLKQGKQFLSC